jgi:hypothetical protein
VSPATTTTTTTAVSSKTTNINTMNKMIDTVVGSLTVVEQQQKQLDVDNINNYMKYTNRKIENIYLANNSLFILFEPI